MPLVQHNQPEPPFRDLLALETSPPGNPPTTDNVPAVRPGPEREAMLRKARLVETASGAAPTRLDPVGLRPVVRLIAPRAYLCAGVGWAGVV